jgi:hypothetical protein
VEQVAVNILAEVVELEDTENLQVLLQVVIQFHQEEFLQQWLFQFQYKVIQ